ncbi:MAG: DUF4350 domain-containing protein, partial [Planctomycetes bacterium]|nr:DUF4350 domain-containing protein [Planctomycetota bacterium]
MRQGIFSRSALVILVAGAAGLLAASFLLSAYERPDLRLGNAAGPGTYSVAAIGHAAWYSLLEELGPHVIRDNDNATSVMDSDDVLVIAEPDLGTLRGEAGIKFFAPGRLLLVLPKWRGIPDKSRPEWVKDVEPVPPAISDTTLHLVAKGGRVERESWPGQWKVNEFSVVPTGDTMVQLFIHPDAVPLIGTEGGILFGRIDRGDKAVFVLADPDIINNQGIVKGDNADLALEIAYHMIGEYGYIYFDEVVHGRHAEGGPSPLSLLVRFPFVVVTILAVLTGLLLVFSGFRRFGPPRVRRAGLGLEYGKELLLRNSARLLGQAGHQNAVLRRHIDLTLRQTAEALHAPPGLDRTALTEWLDRIAASRGAGSCREILDRAAHHHIPRGTMSGELFNAAAALRAWQERVINGNGQHRENS